MITPIVNSMVWPSLLVVYRGMRSDAGRAVGGLGPLNVRTRRAFGWTARSCRWAWRRLRFCFGAREKLLSLRFDEFAVIRRIKIQRGAPGSEVLDEYLSDDVRRCGGEHGHGKRTDHLPSRHALYHAANTHGGRPSSACGDNAPRKTRDS